MQRMLLDWVSGPDVGHVAEALSVARGFVLANPGLEVHLLLNGATTLELASLSSDIACVYPAATEPLSCLGEASFAAVPREWDFVVRRPREPSEPAEQRALFELVRRYFEARHWAGTFGTAMVLGGGLDYRGGQSIGLTLPNATAFEGLLRGHSGIKIALHPAPGFNRGAFPPIDWWCQLLSCALVGQSHDGRGVPASA